MLHGVGAVVVTAGGQGQHVRLGQHLAHLVGHVQRGTLGGPGVQAQVEQHHHELVAALAGHGVLGAQAVLHAPRRFLQQQVAGGVAMGVVERLEVVQVQEDDRAVLVRAHAAHQRLRQALVQQAAVGQLGQGVVEGQVLDLRLVAFAFGQVAQAGQQQRLAVDLHGVERDFGREEQAVVQALVDPLEAVAAQAPGGGDVLVGQRGREAAAWLALRREVGGLVAAERGLVGRAKQLQRHVVAVDEALLLQHQHGLAGGLEQGAETQL